MSDDVTITVRVNNQTAVGIRDVNGQLRTLDGRFAASAGSMNRSGSAMSKALVDVKATLLSLAPAAVPVAAALTPIALHAGAAGLAVGAFGLAVKGQMGAMKAANDAQSKYSAAVAKHGAASKEAAQAEGEYLAQVEGLDPATRRAAAGMSVLTGQFQSWSKSLAGDTMPVFTKGLAVAGAILPKLTPMVKGASTELNRLVTVAGGAVNTSGFDVLSKKVSGYANNSLKKAVDGTIHFARVLSEGNMHGPIASFMDYAHEQGPAVKELFTNLAAAVSNLLEGAAQAGPGLLSLVNALAKMVAAAPPELVGTLMSIYAAFKLIKLAGAGIGSAAGGIQTLATKITALQAASAAAGGGLAGLKAAFASLGTAAKATLIVAGIAAVATVITKLSGLGREAPPNVEKLTTALGNLGRTGKASGEAARLFGKDLSGLYDSVKNITDPSTTDKIQQGLVKVFSLGMADSTPHNEAKDRLDAIDKGLTSLAQGGKTKIAAQAFQDLQKAYVKSGGSAKDFKTAMDGYNSTLADQAMEAKLTAESQGLFGQAAQDAATKLDAQKASADGLRGAIQALNDAQRAGLGGMIGFEAAIDAAAEAAKKNAGALTMNHGVLDLNSQKARDAASALQDLADKTDSAATSARESGSSWETVNGIYARGRSALIKNAEAMGLTKSQAEQLANQILKIPNKTATVKMNAEDAKRDISSFNAAVKKTPGSKSVTLRALSKSGEQVLASFGLKVKRLPNGSVKVTATNGQALSAIKNVQGAVNGLHGKTIRILTQYFTAGSPSQLAAAHGRAHGGLAPGYADGGQVVQTHPNGGLITGPGTGTSDSIMELSPNGGTYRTSDREYIVQAAAVRKYGVGFLDRLNAGALKLAGFAKGGVTKAEKQARHDAMGDLTISHFGIMGGYKHSEFGSALSKPDSLSSLINSLNQWRSIIMKSTHGGQERTLLKALDSSGRKLLSWEKQLTKVSASLEKAKDKLNSLKDSASQLADSVKSGILSSANITKGASGDGPVTLATVRAGLTQSRDKASALSGALKSLKAKGLSSALLQQIAEAGVEGGGLETAGALQGASSSEIKSLNSLQSQITSSATAAGKTTSDAVYAKAIAAQEKTVKDLTKSQDKLKLSMDKLTKSMEKMIERAFGKKASGGIVGAAATGGLRSGLTMVGEQGFELLDLPAGSRVWSNPDSRRKLASAQAPWASMLNVPRGRSAQPTAAAGHAGGAIPPIVLNVSFGAREFGQIWVDVGRKEVRTRGGLKAALGGMD